MSVQLCGQMKNPQLWGFVFLIASSVVASRCTRAEMPTSRLGPNWVQVNPQAPWTARDSQGEYVFRDHLWIVGGWVSAKAPNLLDVWKSPDGKNWIRTAERAPWEHSDLPVSLVFNDKMWLMGGRQTPSHEYSNQVWSSADGMEWKLVTPRAGWSAREAPSFVVFKNRMWVLGGTEDNYQNNDQTMKNDVWSSANGQDWKLEVANAPWSKRAHGQAVVFDGKIWIMGGGARFPDPKPTNDVWCSDDGVCWTQVTNTAAWQPRLWFSTVVYREQMWVLGGWSQTAGNFGDVWYSSDGKHWTELKSDVIWTKRHEHSAYVFQDKIWVAGGAAEPNYRLDSEVWRLEVPHDWFPDP